MIIFHIFEIWTLLQIEYNGPNPTATTGGAIETSGVSIAIDSNGSLIVALSIPGQI